MKSHETIKSEQVFVPCPLFPINCTVLFRPDKRSTVRGSMLSTNTSSNSNFHLCFRGFSPNSECFSFRIVSLLRGRHREPPHSLRTQRTFNANCTVIFFS